jgi:hypothetical protein
MKLPVALAGCLLAAGVLGSVARAQNCYVVGGSRDTVLQLVRSFAENGGYPQGLPAAFRLLEGIPYGGGGAGCPYDKTLVTCRQLDCVTFVETVLAAALAAREPAVGQATPTDDYLFARYLHHLNRLRYYDGIVDGRSKRITYFTDAMRIQCRNGVCQDVGSLAHAERFQKPIHYMTSNPGRFRGTPNWEDVRRTETTLSNAERFYFPLRYNTDSTDLDLAAVASVVRNGDVVGLTTNVPGLDVSHVGFLTLRNGELCFTHASFVRKAVVVEQSLKQYLLTRNSITGLVVFRPLLGSETGSVR